MPKENNFASWLRDSMAGKPNVYLVRNSGVKENGRPVIDDSRVSKWLKGEQRPSMELASLAARVLGKPQSEALRAAGYTYGSSLQSIERMEREYPTPTRGVLLSFDQVDRLTDIHRSLGDLIAEIKEGGTGDVAPAAQKMNDDDGDEGEGGGTVTPLNPKNPSDAPPTVDLSQEPSAAAPKRRDRGQGDDDA